MKKTIFLTAILIAALSFTGCGGFSKNGGDLTITAKAAHGDLLNNQVDEVRAMGNDGSDDIIIATAPFKNGGFKITLPEKIDGRLLEPMDLESMFSAVPDLTVSNKNVVGTEFYNIIAFKNNLMVGAFMFHCSGPTEMGQAFFLLVDGDCKIYGSQTDPVGSSGKSEIIVDVNLKKGWNIWYLTVMQVGNITSVKFTTQKPDLDLKWYFMGGGPLAPPKYVKPFNFFKKKL